MCYSYGNEVYFIYDKKIDFDIKKPPFQAVYFYFSNLYRSCGSVFQFKYMIIVDYHLSPKQDNSETEKAFQVYLMFIPNRIYIPVH
jgi:hypothetical protein